MWKLFKAEFTYQWIYVLFLIVLASIFYGLALFTSFVNEFFISYNSFMIMLYPVYSLYNEKRTRQSVLLPLSIMNIALSRLLIQMMPVFILYSMFFLFNVICIRIQHIDYFELMANTWIPIIAISLYFAILDFLHCYSWKYNCSSKRY